MAGQHTASLALVWVIKLLADHPGVPTKLLDELQTAMSEAVQDGRLPTCAEIINHKFPISTPCSRECSACAPA